MRAHSGRRRSQHSWLETLDGWAIDPAEGLSRPIHIERADAYREVLALLIPREHRVERSNSLKNWTDEELEAGIDLVKQMLESGAAASGAVIEGTAEPVGMLGPAELEQPQHKRSNRLLEHVDTAVAPKERKPRKRVPSPVDA